MSECGIARSTSEQGSTDESLLLSVSQGEGSVVKTKDCASWNREERTFQLWCSEEYLQMKGTNLCSIFHGNVSANAGDCLVSNATAIWTQGKDCQTTATDPKQVSSVYGSSVPACIQMIVGRDTDILVYGRTSCSSSY